jgi:hypothetical protein
MVLTATNTNANTDNGIDISREAAGVRFRMFNLFVSYAKM